MPLFQMMNPANAAKVGRNLAMISAARWGRVRIRFGVSVSSAKRSAVGGWVSDVFRRGGGVLAWGCEEEWLDIWGVCGEDGGGGCVYDPDDVCLSEEQ